MTWTKLSDDFADDCARAGLSDAAFRTHVEGLLWAMRRETGGYLDAVDIRRAIETELAEDAIAELVATGLWRRVGDGYMIEHAMGDQPEPDVLSARRKKDAERQRRWRRKAAGVAYLEVKSRRDSPRDVQADETRDPGRVGSGRVTTAPKERKVSK